MNGYKYPQDLEEAHEKRQSNRCCRYWTYFSAVLTLISLSLGIADMEQLKNFKENVNNRLQQLEATHPKSRELSPWSGESSEHFEVQDGKSASEVDQQHYNQIQRKVYQPDNCKYDVDRCHISSKIKQKNRKDCPTKFLPKEEEVSSFTQAEAPLGEGSEPSVWSCSEPSVWSCSEPSVGHAASPGT